MTAAVLASIARPAARRGLTYLRRSALAATRLEPVTPVRGTPVRGVAVSPSGGTPVLGTPVRGTPVREAGTPVRGAGNPVRLGVSPPEFVTPSPRPHGDPQIARLPRRG